MVKKSLMYTTLLDTEIVAAHLDDPDWLLVDCRFSLADTEAGRRAYLAGHIPGAIYAHLDEELSNPPATDNGRHPLPRPEVLAARFARMGIGPATQVVVYDDANGMIASRLWWMLRYMGHEAAALLDGGWPAWVAAGYGQRIGEERRATAVFTGRPKAAWVAVLDDLPQARLLVDSRDAARYRGELETIDPVAGHIPGAVNYYFGENVGENGRFLSPDQLRQKLRTLLGETPAEQAVFYCGSGVSACVNLLALAHAGLGNGRLYVGSWSEYCHTL
jgi:thiosulfate/3-mercaptopyruvate sulfurtransferase